MGRMVSFFPTCGSPSKTLSFRAATVTSAMSGDLDAIDFASETESSVESVIRGLKSDRFFFKPGKTSSILEESKEKEKEKENVLMMEMESADPFADFKKSMQEMVEADEGLKEWDNLHNLLSLYLAVNDKINHCYIIGAFVDLMLVNLGSSSSFSCSSSSLMNGQDQSLVTKSCSNSTNNNNNKNTSKKKMIIISESPDSALSFTSSSSASVSASSSSTSHFLSSCSLEEEDEDHNSLQKVAVSDDESSLKI